MASSRSMPQPLSCMRMSRRPPDSMSMRNSLDCASSEFSRSSLTTEAGRSTTSPAAILLATWSGRTRMRPITAPLRSRLGSLDHDAALVEQRTLAAEQVQQIAAVEHGLLHQRVLGGHQVLLRLQHEVDLAGAQLVLLL